MYMQKELTESHIIYRYHTISSKQTNERVIVDDYKILHQIVYCDFPGLIPTSLCGTPCLSNQFSKPVEEINLRQLLATADRATLNFKTFAAKCCALLQKYHKQTQTTLPR